MSLVDAGKSTYPVTRKSYSKLPQILGVPDLIEVQLISFRWFQEEGLRQVLEEVSPIKDFTGNRLELTFVSYEFREPRHSEQECLQRDLTYSAPLYVKTRLLVKGTGEIRNPLDKTASKLVTSHKLVHLIKPDLRALFTNGISYQRYMLLKFKIIKHFFYFL